MQALYTNRDLKEEKRNDTIKAINSIFFRVNTEKDLTKNWNEDEKTNFKDYVNKFIAYKISNASDEELTMELEKLNEWIGNK